jgi:hypothetical protein
MGASDRRVIAAALLTCAACSTPQVIEPPTAESLGARRVERSHGGVRCSAMVLDDAESRDLLRVAAAERDLIALVFALTNLGDQPLPLQQNAFRLRINDTRRIAPALPGRAASLLRDETGSLEAMLAGALVIGPLAAPSIEAAYRREAYATNTSRELIFSATSVAGGNTGAGYLIFESPLPLDEISQLVLEMALPSVGTIELPLTLPARTDPGLPALERPHATKRPRMVESDLPAAGVRNGER